MSIFYRLWLRNAVLVSFRRRSLACRRIFIILDADSDLIAQWCGSESDGLSWSLVDTQVTSLLPFTSLCVLGLVLSLTLTRSRTLTSFSPHMWVDLNYFVSVRNRFAENTFFWTFKSPEYGILNKALKKVGLKYYMPSVLYFHLLS